MSSRGLPNVKWCEETLMGWVTEPANTWSNLAFIIVGLIIFSQSRQSKNIFLKLFASAAILCGLGSGLYHASYNFIFQVGDFFGMYLIFFLPLLLNVERMGIEIKKPILVYSLLVSIYTVLTVVFYYQNIPIQLLIVSILVAVLGTEAYLFNRNRFNDYSNLYLSMLSLGIGATFSALDVTRTVCDPQNHFFQGHATWHLFSALTIYFNFKFYNQIFESGHAQEGAVRA
jgi:predicted membrane channel-forming protein YqfA (hemolysin III family)